MYSRPSAADSRFGANSYRLKPDENRRPNFSRSEPALSSFDVDMKDVSATSGRVYRASPAPPTASSSFGQNRQALRERPTGTYRPSAISRLMAPTASSLAHRTTSRLTPSSSNGSTMPSYARPTASSTIGRHQVSRIPSAPTKKSTYGSGTNRFQSSVSASAASSMPRRSSVL
ncbi:unnamed protein product [Peronospora belbahrii]|uniref:Uncharacterized protein n=1 Tax=Peronospora belbahrii TaxID=622444 RepID=A0AAU9KT43_9STRA|nr:unnamed protein product [Peronospora belbahrii]CAH0520802.1 unnamed protein product [Peronospora belbahrii]